MEYGQLGRSGLLISRVIMHGLHLSIDDQKAADTAVGRAFDVGITTFYTGDDYLAGDTERALGEAVKSRRDSVVIMAKGGYRVGAWGNYSRNGSPEDGGEDYRNQTAQTVDHNRLWRHGVAPTDRGTSRKHLTAALDASLRRLQTDYIDVYIPHFVDPHVPVDETLSTLSDFVRQGKVLYIGCSQSLPWQIYRALWTAELRGFERYECVQVNLSLFERASLRDSLPALREVGVGMLAGAPDVGSALDQYRARDASGDFPAATALAAEKLLACASALGREPRELALAWVLAHDGVSGMFIGQEAIPEDFGAHAAAAEHPLSAEEYDAVTEAFSSVPENVTLPRRPASRTAS
jgi:1-deoxyxylulose-5-phosphate synthase